MIDVLLAVQRLEKITHTILMLNIPLYDERIQV